MPKTLLICSSLVRLWEQKASNWMISEYISDSILLLLSAATSVSCTLLLDPNYLPNTLAWLREAYTGLLHLFPSRSHRPTPVGWVAPLRAQILSLRLNLLVPPHVSWCSLTALSTTPSQFEPNKSRINSSWKVLVPLVKKLFLNLTNWIQSLACFWSGSAD